MVLLPQIQQEPSSPVAAPVQSPDHSPEQSPVPASRHPSSDWLFTTPVAGTSRPLSGQTTALRRRKRRPHDPLIFVRRQASTTSESESEGAQPFQKRMKSSQVCSYNVFTVGATYTVGLVHKVLGTILGGCSHIILFQTYFWSSSLAGK